MKDLDDITWSSPTTFNGTWGIIYDSTPKPWYKRLWDWLRRRDNSPLLVYIDFTKEDDK